TGYLGASSNIFSLLTYNFLLHRITSKQISHLAEKRKNNQLGFSKRFQGTKKEEFLKEGMLKDVHQRRELHLHRI
ncbi:hypothetical protein C5167_024842, partial [Papaver somniferum]